MTPGAYHLIDTFGLRRPKTYSLDEILSLPTTVDIYARFRKKQLAPAAVSSEYVTANRAIYENLLLSGELLHFEDRITSVCAGCVVTSPAGCYVEVVLGHLSGLVRRGWCCLRAFDSGINLRYSLVNQNKLIIQTSNGDIVCNTRQPDLKTSLASAQSVIASVAHIRSEHLFEFMIDVTGRLVFSDAKIYPWKVKFDSLFVDEKFANACYSMDPSNITHSYSGPFDVAHCDSVNASTAVYIGANAILSHFVTYGLDLGVLTLLLP